MEAKPYLQSIELKRDAIESFSGYPFSVPVIRELDYLDFHPDVTFFVGENGTGKSTLIEAIALAMGFGAEGGTRNVHISTADDQSGLSEYVKLMRSFAKPKDYYFLRAESFYNVATYMDSVGYLEGSSRRLMKNSVVMVSTSSMNRKRRYHPNVSWRLWGQFMRLLKRDHSSLSQRIRQYCSLTPGQRSYCSIKVV